jgi:hypothetical protein
VSCDASGWQLGTKHEKRGPFKQANDAKWRIVNRLKERGFVLDDVPFVHAVWFTKIPRSSLPVSIEWTEFEVFTKEDLSSDICEVISTHFRQILPDWAKQRRTLAPIDRLTSISQELRPFFEANQKPTERKREIERHLETALKSQKEMIEFAIGGRSSIIDGLPGTGKTFAAVQIARELGAKGQNILFVCFNRLLAAQIQTELVDFDSVQVFSFHALLKALAEIEIPENPEEDWWKTQLPNVVLQKLEDSYFFGFFDALIVDEAQDLALPNYLEILDLLLVDGLTKSPVFVFGDFQYQDIYLENKRGLELWKSFIPNANLPSPLIVNCRNTEICGENLVHLLNIQPGYSAYRRNDVGPDPEIKLIQSDVALAAELRATINNLLKVYGPTQIVVLSSYRREIESLISRLDIKATPIGTPKPNAIRWGTVYEFKGLEALAVVFVASDNSHSQIRELCFIAGTRALQSFVGIMTNSAFGKLNGNIGA